MKYIKFSVNNWFLDRDYPSAEPFRTWMGCDWQIPFRNEDWVKANKLVVVYSQIDMSQNFCVTAPLDWVTKNCPCILGSQFEYPEDAIEDRFDIPFLDYMTTQIGIHNYDYNEGNGWEDPDDYDYDEDSGIETNEYGCSWSDGIGYAPDGHCCGECENFHCADCPVRLKHDK